MAFKTTAATTRKFSDSALASVVTGAGGCMVNVSCDRATRLRWTAPHDRGGPSGREPHTVAANEGETEMLSGIDVDAALRRFLKLAAIEGISGKERPVIDAIIAMLQEAGVDPRAMRTDDANSRSHIGGEVGNLIVDIPGTIPGPTTLLSAHTDTVPVCVGSDPVVDGDLVRSRNPASGLGGDDRAGCATLVTAVTELLRSRRPHPPIKLLFFVQEEIGLAGSRNLDPALIGPVDRAFNFDGGRLEKVTVGATGGERITIELHGTPAHAGVAPQTGASAIVMAARAIDRLHRDGWLGLVDKPGIGVGTSNVGVINGGDATNVITPLVRLRAEARSHNPVMRKRIVEEICGAFQAAAAEVTTDCGTCGRADFSTRIDYDSFRLADDDPIVVAVKRAIEATGRVPYCDVTNGGLDANWLHKHGIPAATLGCGQLDIHTTNEKLSIPDYLDACRVALRLISAGHPESATAADSLRHREQDNAAKTAGSFAVRGVVKHGTVTLDDPHAIADGTVVQVVPVGQKSAHEHEAAVESSDQDPHSRRGQHELLGLHPHHHHPPHSPREHLGGWPIGDEDENVDGSIRQWREGDE
jgi:tripeptide aminopeptidase